MHLANSDAAKRANAPTSASATEHSDIELLHAISVELIGEHDRVALYGKIVDAAVAIARSQFGTMQLLCPLGDPSGHGGELQLLASRGLPPEAVEFWQWVNPAAYSSCTEALKSGSRAIIPDFEHWDEIAGTPDLDAFRQTGIRSAQTTPLLSRTGELLGMISTHWDRPHQPTERDLRLLDILARQAADLLERTIAEEALRTQTKVQRLLTGELSHRVKNMLATVQAIATQTLRHSQKPQEFVSSFSGRIQSMARVHAQLSENEWQGTQLADIVQDQMKLGPVDETRIAASGPDVCLPTELVPTMAMMMHELGTNSLKYGALANANGTVDVRWTVSGETLNLRWVERGGPASKAPIRPGFGTSLIQSSAAGAGGKAQMSHEAEGVRWEIVLPLPQNAARRAQLSGSTSDLHGSKPRAVGVTAAKPLAGKRFLIVEDEPLVAMDIGAQLTDAGAAVLGPAGNTSSALTLIEQEQFDAALLDANLGGQPVDDVAAALTRKNIPFAFVSGYGRDSLPKPFSAAELLSKPFAANQLMDVASRLTGANAGAAQNSDSVIVPMVARTG